MTKIDEEKGRYSVTLPVIVIDDDQSLDSMGWNLNSKAKHSIGSVMLACTLKGVIMAIFVSVMTEKASGYFGRKKKS